MYIISNKKEVIKVNKNNITMNSKDTIYCECYKCGKDFNISAYALKKRGVNYKNIKPDELICKTCRTQETNIKKYGVKSLLEKEGIRKSGLPDGIENVSQLENVKEKKKEKFNSKTQEEKKDIYNKVKATQEKKYGGYFASTNEYKNLLKKKYGVKNNFQREDVKDKIKETNLKKYGFESYTHTKEYKEKTRKTSLERYGYTSPMKDRDIKEKSIRKKIDNNGWYSWFSTEEFKSKRLIDNFNKVKERLKSYNIVFIEEEYAGTRPEDINKNYKFKCKNCGNIFVDNIHSKIPKCPTCFPKYGSILEKEVSSFLANYSDLIQNDRKILNGKEIDILIPERNLGIEFDGLYWHSENSGGKLKNYHLNKTLEAKSNNIKLIHIFEDEWVFKKDIVKSILLSNFNIYSNKIGARKTSISFVDKERSTLFLNENHLQGSINGDIAIGLYYNEELISLLLIGKPRFNKKYDWEILRFANKLNTKVMGGFSKLFKYFTSNYNGSIITYSDLRYFNGSVYESNGFKYIKTTKPNYYYMDNYNIRYNRINFQKHKLNNILENFDEDLTEWENMKTNGFDRIWDCGNNAFEYTIDKNI